MIELFFAFLGKYAAQFIELYRDNQTWLNAIVVIYGILLALAHRNVLRMEQHLRRVCGLNNMHKIWVSLENNEIDNFDLKKLKQALWLPILTSPLHLFISPVTKKNLLKILKKKYPRSETHG